MKTFVLAAAVLAALLPAVAFAREATAPEGCYIRIDRDGTFICCPGRIKTAWICKQQTIITKQE